MNKPLLSYNGGSVRLISLKVDQIAALHRVVSLAKLTPCFPSHLRSCSRSSPTHVQIPHTPLITYARKMYNKQVKLFCIELNYVVA